MLGEIISPSLNILPEPARISWPRQPEGFTSFVLFSLLPPSVSTNYCFGKDFESATNSEKKMKIELDLFIRQTLLKDWNEDEPRVQILKYCQRIHMTPDNPLTATL